MKRLLDIYNQLNDNNAVSAYKKLKSHDENSFFKKPKQPEHHFPILISQNHFSYLTFASKIKYLIDFFSQCESTLNQLEIFVNSQLSSIAFDIAQIKEKRKILWRIQQPLFNTLLNQQKPTESLLATIFKQYMLFIEFLDIANHYRKIMTIIERDLKPEPSKQVVKTLSQTEKALFKIIKRHLDKISAIELEEALNEKPLDTITVLQPDLASLLLVIEHISSECLLRCEVALKQKLLESPTFETLKTFLNDKRYSGAPIIELIECAIELNDLETLTLLFKLLDEKHRNDWYIQEKLVLKAAFHGFAGTLIFIYESLNINLATQDGLEVDDLYAFLSNNNMGDFHVSLPLPDQDSDVSDSEEQPVRARVSFLEILYIRGCQHYILQNLKKLDWSTLSVDAKECWIVDLLFLYAQEFQLAKKPTYQHENIFKILTCLGDIQLINIFLFEVLQGLEAKKENPRHYLQYFLNYIVEHDLQPLLTRFDPDTNNSLLTTVIHQNNLVLLSQFIVAGADYLHQTESNSSAYHLAKELHRDEMVSLFDLHNYLIRFQDDIDALKEKIKATIQPVFREHIIARCILTTDEHQKNLTDFFQSLNNSFSFDELAQSLINFNNKYQQFDRIKVITDILLNSIQDKAVVKHINYQALGF